MKSGNEKRHKWGSSIYYQSFYSHHFSNNISKFQRDHIFCFDHIKPPTTKYLFRLSLLFLNSLSGIKRVNEKTPCCASVLVLQPNDKENKSLTNLILVKATIITFNSSLCCFLEASSTSSNNFNGLMMLLISMVFDDGRYKKNRSKSGHFPTPSWPQHLLMLGVIL